MALPLEHSPTPSTCHPAGWRWRTTMAGNVHELRPKTATLDLGLRHFTREDLEKVHAAGQTLDIHVLGLASIADDVTPDLARATITSIEVLGALHASAEVKAALPLEATRLTHEGRLTEATALLQRMLQSGMEPDARTDGTAAGSPPARAAPIIELTPEVIEAPRSAPTGWAEANSDGSQPGHESAMARMPMPDWARLLEKAGRSGLMRSRAR